MEWDAPAIVLDARPYGEGDAIVTVLTEEHGAHRGLARGGNARSHTALWQPGNLIQVRWVARLADQLGSFSAELVHPGAALAMHDPLSLAMLSAACAVAEGALPEREPHPRVFEGLLHLIAHLPQGAAHADRPDPLGDGPAGRSRLRPGSRELCGHRRHHRARFRVAEDRPRGHRSGRRRLDIATAATARVPAGRGGPAAANRTGAMGCG